MAGSRWPIFAICSILCVARTIYCKQEFNTLESKYERAQFMNVERDGGACVNECSTTV